MFPKKLSSKLKKRKSLDLFRDLSEQNGLVDFSSNDYLGFSRSTIIFGKAHQFLTNRNLKNNGSTGSRLLSGNHDLFKETETMLSQFHNIESALIFNSGYNANIGFFSSVPQKGDIIYFDEFIHASIREGILLSKAKAYKFRHNDLDDLKKKILRSTQNDNQSQIGSKVSEEVYIVTESVFSMDGDSPDLLEMQKICDKYITHLVVDEAHAVGVFGEQGRGLVQSLGLEDRLFARIITFGKALGGHGAAVLGSKELKEYLINFARSFIYTTALPPHTLSTVMAGYNELLLTEEIGKLLANIGIFKAQIERHNLQTQFLDSKSAIQCCLIPGNDKVKEIARQLQEKGFDVKPILSPTIPQGMERLRFCLHSYNSENEIREVLQILANFIY